MYNYFDIELKNDYSTWQDSVHIYVHTCMTEDEVKLYYTSDSNIYDSLRAYHSWKSAGGYKAINIRKITKKSCSNIATLFIS